VGKNWQVPSATTRGQKGKGLSLGTSVPPADAGKKLLKLHSAKYEDVAPKRARTWAESTPNLKKVSVKKLSENRGRAGSLE